MKTEIKDRSKRQADNADDKVEVDHVKIAESYYVDKHKAAAVTIMGQQDLLTDLKVNKYLVD